MQSGEIVIGIDPGKTGGIAVLSMDGVLIEKVKNPKTPREAEGKEASQRVAVSHGIH